MPEYSLRGLQLETTTLNAGDVVSFVLENDHLRSCLRAALAANAELQDAIKSISQPDPVDKMRYTPESCYDTGLGWPYTLNGRSIC